MKPIKKFEDVKNEINIGDYVLYHFSASPSIYYYIFIIYDLRDYTLYINPLYVVKNGVYEDDCRDKLRLSIHNKDLIYNSKNIEDVKKYYSLITSVKKYNL